MRQMRSEADIDADGRPDHARQRDQDGDADQGDGAQTERRSDLAPAQRAAQHQPDVVERIDRQRAEEQPPHDVARARRHAVAQDARTAARRRRQVVGPGHEGVERHRDPIHEIGAADYVQHPAFGVFLAVLVVDAEFVGPGDEGTE